MLHPDAKHCLERLSKSNGSNILVFQPLSVNVSKWEDVISLSGRTSDDIPLLVDIRNFRNYFFIDRSYIPDTMGMAAYKSVLESGIRTMFPRYKYEKDDIVELLERIDDNVSVYGGENKPLSLYKISVNNRTKLKPLAAVIRSHFEKVKRENGTVLLPEEPRFYDNECISYESKFFRDRWFSLSNWAILVDFRQARNVKTHVFQRDKPERQHVEVDFRNVLTIPYNYVPVNPLDNDTIDIFQRFVPTFQGGWDSTPNYTILFFDIECINYYKPNEFPDTTFHQVGAVSLLFCRADETYDNPVGKMERTVLVVGEPGLTEDYIEVCGQKVRFIIEPYATERDLLKAFARKIETYNPDCISGYNSDNFDVSYLYSRCNLWGVSEFASVLSKFPNYSFYISDFARKQANNRQGAAAAYTRTDLNIIAPGYTDIDMLRVAKDNRIGSESSSYKLGVLVPHVLKDDRLKKLDMPPNEIGDHFYGDSTKLRKLIGYCMMDTELVAILLLKRRTFMDFIEKSRILNTDMNTVITRGQCAKVINAILIVMSKVRGNKERIPDRKPDFSTIKHNEKQDSLSEEEFLQLFGQEARNLKKYIDLIEKDVRDSSEANKPSQIMLGPKKKRGAGKEEGSGGEDSYSGATVMTMQSGFYYSPKWYISVMDFNALYPRVMMIQNLCFSTIIPDMKLWLKQHPHARFGRDYFVAFGTNVGFTKLKLGLIPQVAEMLLKARMEVKKDMKTVKERDLFKYNLLDLRQNNIKVACNSLYGLMGTNNSPIAANVVAATITYVGRVNIGMVKMVIEKEFPDRKVIYGDTDSVFVLMPKRMQFTKVFEEADRMATKCNVKVPITSDSHMYAAAKILFQHTGRLAYMPDWLLPEKVLKNALMIKKKKYIAVMFEQPDKPGRILYKGVEVVRGDAVGVVKNVLRDSLEALFEKSVKSNTKLLQEGATELYDDSPDVDSGANVVRKYVSALYHDDGTGFIIPLTLYTKVCSVKSESYVTPPAAAVVRNRLIRNKVSNAPELCEKFQTVKIASVGKKDKITDCTREIESEIIPDPKRIDSKYYTECLLSSLESIWSIILRAVRDNPSLVSDKSLIADSVKGALFETVKKQKSINLHEKFAMERMFANVTKTDDKKHRSEWSNELKKSLDSEKVEIAWNKVELKTFKRAGSPLDSTPAKKKKNAEITRWFKPQA